MTKFKEKKVLMYNMFMLYLDGDGFPGERFLHTLSRLPTLDEAVAMYATLPGAVIAMPLVVKEPGSSEDKPAPNTILVYNKLSSSDSHELGVTNLKSLEILQAL